MLEHTRFQNPLDHLRATAPSEPVLYFSQDALEERVRVFQNGFAGTLCYAVKCNAHPEILHAFAEAGLEEFDVASPQEIALMRKIAPHARLNYNNPIRSREEIRFALDHGVKSFSVDCIEELQKLADTAQAEFSPEEIEVSVRLKLDLDGSAYHFGDKFGESPDQLIELLQRAQSLGFKTSGTFHVGTQCENPENYRQYIETMADCARQAGVELDRLNVGGGFPSARNGVTPDFSAFFAAIEQGLQAFAHRPQLLAEPGRALIADACQYLVQIKSIRHGRWAFLNDGVYGGLSDVKLMGATPYHLYTPAGEPCEGEKVKYNLYGPTCDSIDSFAESFYFPKNTEEGDYLLFDGAGAYLLGLNTSFNGYGHVNFTKVTKLIS